MASTPTGNSAAVQPGRNWICRRRRHKGWLVEVLKVSQRAVFFVVRYGPGHCRGTNHQMATQVFLNSFEPLRG